jgi:hypothetical protein
VAAGLYFVRLRGAGPAAEAGAHKLVRLE